MLLLFIINQYGLAPSPLYKFVCENSIRNIILEPRILLYANSCTES